MEPHLCEEEHQWYLTADHTLCVCVHVALNVSSQLWKPNKIKSFSGNSPHSFGTLAIRRSSDRCMFSDCGYLSLSSQ